MVKSKGMDGHIRKKKKGKQCDDKGLEIAESCFPPL